MSIISTKNITKKFPSGETYIEVLHDITIELPSGQLNMIVGPSGCGKTTLLSIISGILSPTSGNVLIDKVDITNLNDTEKVIYRRKNMGFIFQQYNLLPTLTAAENASIALIADGMSFFDAESKTLKLFDALGLLDKGDKLPSQLSGGEQQRVAIARALVHDPKLVVCDEPTASLDAMSGKVVMEMLKNIVLEKDRAVIVVTHDTRIFDFADRIYYMNDGRIDKQEEIKKQ